LHGVVLKSEEIALAARFDLRFLQIRVIHVSAALGGGTRRNIMPTFTIDPDNNITALIEVPAGASPENAFSSEKELAKLTTEWPMARVIDVWNSFAGVAPFDDLKPVKKFTSRSVAVARIWAAVERLLARPGKPARDRASTSQGSKKAAAESARRGGAQKTEKESPRNKKAEVIALLKRAKGATLGEIEAATGWQKHTIRGLVSTLGSKGGLKIESSKSDSGERTYRVTK
jgi:hypothetical protein